MGVGRANKRVGGQIGILPDKFFRCDAKAKFQSLVAQVFGDKSQLREDAEMRFVDVCRDEDAVQGVDDPFYGVEVYIQR